MASPRQLHLQAMELMDTALSDERDEARTLRLLQDALNREAAAADALTNDLEAEPTRSLLHRGAASIAMRIQEVATAKRYAEAGLAGNVPAEIREDLNQLYEQILTLEALMRDYRRKAPIGVTRITQINRRFRSTAPVDVEGLAAALGLAIQKRDLEPDTFGTIYRDVYRGGFGGFTALINSRHPVREQRVTIAHEIAHLQRHRDRPVNRLIDDRLHRTEAPSTKEQEAIELADHLLIPGELLGQFRNAGITKAEDLAEKFEVPLSVMKRRMRFK